MGSPRCNWVRDRLALWVGDDLRGPDRRRVERHLIGCPHCREYRASLVQALEALRTAASSAPARADAPSLWPALARQIREERRPVPTPLLSFALSWLRVNSRPALGLGLGLLVAVGAGFGVRQRIVAAQAQVASNIPTPPRVASAPPKIPVVQDVPAAQAPAAQDQIVSVPRPRPRSKPRSEAPTIENNRGVDYDPLERGRPMPETRDTTY
jgi:anti-sigma factor RsiW